jgi:hypothetical protein
MSYLLVGVLALALIFWPGRGRGWLLRPEWRVASAAAALGLFLAAAFVGIMGGWAKGLELALVGAILAASSRWRWRRPPPAEPAPKPRDETMSLRAARALLGVGEGATPEDVQAAYARLMRRAHPDHGGTVGLATQLNLARERLLKR